MIRLAVVAVLVAVAFGDNCCPPWQWESVMGGTGGIVTNGEGMVVQAAGFVSYDRKNQRLAMFMNTTVGPTFTRTWVIYDYSKKVQFVINLKDQTCSKGPTPEGYNNGCVPASMKAMVPFYYGPTSDSLNGVIYSGNIKIQGADLAAYLAVTEKDCIPVGENFFGQAGKVQMVQSYGFINVTSGIRDPSVFNPPSYCDQPLPHGSIPTPVTSLL